MKKNIYFDRFGKTRFAATTENGKLVEFEMESEDTAEIVGNIYKGRVVNVLGGMDAAFVYCGLARNGYLSASDMNSWESEGAPASASRQLSVKEGDEVLVQIVKSPRGNKGAKVTTRLSFVGKDLIYMPDSDFIGVSHKIVDEELREMLAGKVRELSGGEGGFIVRTSAPYVSGKQLKDEIERLRRRHRTVLERAKTAAVGEAIFVESTMPAKVLRNLIADEIDAIVASEPKIYGEIAEVLGYQDAKMAQKLRLYEGERDMLYAEGVAQQLAGAPQAVLLAVQRRIGGIQLLGDALGVQDAAALLIELFFFSGAQLGHFQLFHLEAQQFRAAGFFLFVHVQGIQLLFHSAQLPVHLIIRLMLGFVLGIGVQDA